MGKLTLSIEVKFRAFGITFGTVKDRIVRVVPARLYDKPMEIFRFDECGVTVIVEYEPLPVKAERT